MLQRQGQQRSRRRRWHVRYCPDGDAPDKKEPSNLPQCLGCDL